VQRFGQQPQSKVSFSFLITRDYYAKEIKPSIPTMHVAHVATSAANSINLRFCLHHAAVSEVRTPKFGQPVVHNHLLALVLSNKTPAGFAVHVPFCLTTNAPATCLANVRKFIDCRRWPVMRLWAPALNCQRENQKLMKSDCKEYETYFCENSLINW
jgi:hypothetical protein